MTKVIYAYQEFENKILSIINSVINVNNKENVIYNNKIGFDILLPNGCKYLGILPNTAIELKIRLRADTLYTIYNYYKLNKENFKIERLIIIYQDDSAVSEGIINYFNRRLNDKNIEEYSWKEKREMLLNKARLLFNEGRNTLFLGAGLGVDVGMPKWDKLLNDLLNKAKNISHSKIGGEDYPNIDLSCNHSALIVGRYIEQSFKNINEFKVQIHKSLYINNPSPDSELYKELTEVILTKKVSQVITFNYDDLIETALLKKNFPVHSVFDRSHYSGNEFPVYHVHGMIPQKRQIDSTPVLSESTYHTLYKESFHWSNVIQLNALNWTTCFFIGLSMNDPNLRRLLDISQNGVEKVLNDEIYEMPCHYVFLERYPLDENNPDEYKDLEHFSLQEKMMAKLGINILWFEKGQFNEIPKMMKIIRS